MERDGTVWMRMERPEWDGRERDGTGLGLGAGAEAVLWDGMGWQGMWQKKDGTGLEQMQMGLAWGRSAEGGGGVGMQK